MMQDVTLIINGLDVSSRVLTYSAQLSINYAKVITTLDDVEHPFPGVKRSVLRFSFLPMTEDEADSVYWCMRDLIFPVTYSNPRGGGVLTKKFRLMTDIEAVFLLLSVDGKRRYNGGQIELRAI